MSELLTGDEVKPCCVCKKPTVFYKMSIMGSIEIPLCEEHKNKEPYAMPHGNTSFLIEMGVE